NINNMVKNHILAKHIMDHAWGRLIQYATYKAARAGKSVELVDSRYKWLLIVATASTSVEARHRDVQVVVPSYRKH
ncbi:MAG: hypothetical protein QW781_06845, partial [Methanothrix sp.]